ncbi:MAG: PKD domain-containing protein [Bacteroidota bacterium]
MKKSLIFLFVLTTLTSRLFAQCSSTPMIMNNPSFEGTLAPHVTPTGWDICMPGCTPDTQPGSWGITLPPSNGSSYVAFVQDPTIPWQEGAGQTLPSPMVAGQPYSFTIDLATTAVNGSGIVPGCVELQMWGGWSSLNSGCDMSELLWSSGDIYNAAHMDLWVTHTVSFTPTQPWDHFLLVINSLGCTNGPYIMLDNMSPMIPVADSAWFNYGNATTLGPFCFGDTAHFHDLSVSPMGTINSWTWVYGDGSPNGTTQNPTHYYSAPGTYNVTLTTISTVPCTSTVTLPVVVYPQPTASITGSTNAACGVNNGSATAAGGIGYSWSTTPVQNTATATGLGSGIYICTVTNANGCSDTTSVTISSASGLSGTVTVVDESCGLGNGSATANPSSGTAPYTYAWNTVPAQITQTATNLVAGNYTVTITDVAGCTFVINCVVGNSPGVAVSTTSTDENCGHSNGTATATPAGGTAPFDYEWSSIPVQYTQVATNLPAGTYTVTVTDDAGCTGTASAVVTNIPGPSAAITNIIHTYCNQSNGAAVVTAMNGVPPYTYLWNTVPAQMVDSAINLAAGNYSVTVTDNNGCTAVNNVTIDPSAGPALTMSSTDENCGQGNGTASVSVVGGSGIYTYIWNNGNPTSSLSNVSAGSYTVTVDDGTCVAVANVTVGNIPGPVAAFTQTPSVATIDEALFSFYDQSTGNIISWAWTFGDGATSVIQNPTHSYTSIGTFAVSLTVTDAQGCKDSIQSSVRVKEMFAIYLPNTFSPNGDGMNETFGPKGVGIDPNEFDFRIYNRWGEEIFATTSVSNSWDGSVNGKLVKSDVYVWILNVKEIDGPSRKLQGHVSVIK